MTGELSVFVSSTSVELSDYRSAVCEAIQHLDGFTCDSMDSFGARGQLPRYFDDSRVSAADIFVGIVGHLFGSHPADSENSFCELEFDVATAACLPRFMFLASDDFPTWNSIRESDDYWGKQKKFRERVESEVVRATFSNISELTLGVCGALCNHSLQQNAGSEHSPITLTAPPQYPMPKRPFPVLEPYSHPYTFVGREEEVEFVLEQFTNSKLILCISSPSGAGKSSLLNAGVVPKLHQKSQPVAYDRFPGQSDLYTRLVRRILDVGTDTNWLSPSTFKNLVVGVFKQSRMPLVIVLDQFETVLHTEGASNLDFISTLLTESVNLVTTEGHLCRWVFSYRQEAHGAMVQWLESIPERASQSRVFSFAEESHTHFFHLHPLGAKMRGSALDVFRRAIEQPLRLLNAQGQPHFSLRISSSDATRLASVFSEERRINPTSPLTPEFQVVLDALISSSPRSADGATWVTVPDDLEGVVERSLLEHLTRKLLAAYPHPETSGARTLAAITLRRVSEFEAGGMPAGQLCEDGDETLNRAVSTLCSQRLLLEIHVGCETRYVLPHTALSKAVRELFNDAEVQSELGIKNEAVELQSILDHRVLLSNRGDPEAASLSRSMVRQINRNKSNLSWSTDTTLLFERSERRQRKQTIRAVLLLTITLSILGGLVWLYEYNVEVGKRMVVAKSLESRFRTERHAEAVDALVELIDEFGYEGEKLSLLINSRVGDDFEHVIAQGVYHFDDLERTHATTVIAAGVLEAEIDGIAAIGALLSVIDSVDQTAELVKTRGSLVALLRAKSTPPDIQEINWAKIEGTSFKMGSDPKIYSDRHDEMPQRYVTLASYSIMTREVPTSLYVQFDTSHGSESEDDTSASRVSWFEAYAFCAWLHDDCRLPTEAQWECAARAESELDYSYQLEKGQSIDSPNKWGLVGVHSGVWEWCQDWFAVYDKTERLDPQGPVVGRLKVTRGGGEFSGRRGARSAFRFPRAPGRRYPNLGFRAILLP